MKSYSDTIKFLGEDLEKGALPALFYFALSAEDSLLLSPFNQIVTELQSPKIRIFSMTIPGHGNNLPKEDAIKYWKKHMQNDNSLLETFFRAASYEISKLKENGIISPNQFAIAGLSRGAFVAMHIAAKVPWIQSILGFAPLTKLSNANEFAEIKTRPHIRSLDLDMQIEALANRSIRFYIGNRDRRVGTTHCFDLVKTLAEEAYKKRISSSPIELIVGPSIGYQGHGTSDETFSDGALWIKNKLML